MTRRDLLAAATGAAVAAATPATASEHPAEPQADDRRNWFRRTLVGIEIGPTGANDRDSLYMSKATGAEWVRLLLKAKAEYGVIFLKDMEFAYYSSRVARKCPNLGERDLLQETLEAAKPHGLPIIAYCQIQYDDSSWRAHPEWRMKDHQGTDLGGRLCFNTDYFDFVRDVAAEMMQYPIAGFHFDMLDFGFAPPVGCWCPRCREAFRREFGSEMPNGVTWDEAWDRMLAFRARSNKRFEDRLQAFVRSKRPDISVDFNYHGYPPFNWLPGQTPAIHAASGDFVTAEGLPWIFGHNNVSLLPLFLSAARPDRAVQCVSSRGVWDYHDFTVRPVAEMTWEVLTYLAHGAKYTMVDKLYYDGAAEPLTYERLGEVFGEARRKRDLWGHAPVPEVGIWYSLRSRDWYGRDDPPRYLAAVWGAHRALLQSHIPMGFVLDELADADRLRAFPVVWLPHAAIVSEREAAMLDAYVREGGKLLLTGLTGMFDRQGQPRGEWALAATAGARLVRTHTDRRDNYLRLPASVKSGAGAFLARDVPVDWPMLVYGPLAELEPAGAEAYGELWTPVRSTNNLWVGHMSPGTRVGPAALVRRHGKGMVVTVPCALDAAYAGEYRMPEHRLLVRNLVRALNPAPPVEVRAPVHVEAVVTRDAGRRRWVVHLLAFTGAPTFSSAAFPNGKRVLPAMMEEAGPYEAEVTVRVPFRRLTASGPRARVSVRGGVARIATRNIHEAVVIEE